MAEVAHRVAKQGFSVCLPNPRGIGQSAGSAPILDLQAEQDPFAPFVNAHDLAKELGQPIVIDKPHLRCAFRHHGRYGDAPHSLQGQRATCEGFTGRSCQYDV